MSYFEWDEHITLFNAIRVSETNAETLCDPDIEAKLESYETEEDLLKGMGFTTMEQLIEYVDANHRSRRFQIVYDGHTFVRIIRDQSEAALFEEKLNKWLMTRFQSE